MIGSQVGWLNKSGTLQGKISFSDVIEPLMSVDVNYAMKILKDLEAAGPTIKNPTDYIFKAAVRACGGGGRFPPVQPYVQQRPIPRGPPAGGMWAPRGGAAFGQSMATSMQDPTGKITRQVEWLNKNLELQQPIVFEEVIRPLASLDIKTAMQILKEVETQGVGQECTAFIRSLAEQAGANMSAGPTRARFGGPVGGGRVMPDPTGKISKQVTWLNNNVQLSVPIDLDAVIGPLSSMDVKAAMQILKQIETSGGQVADPTAHIKELAEQAGADMSAVATMKASSMNIAPIQKSVGGGGGGRGAKRAWTEEDASPDDSDASKSISKQIGRINSHAMLMEKVSYSDVKPHLELLDMQAAGKILKDLSDYAHTIKHPTQYVIAAAKRALAGEAIPSKRPRGEAWANVN